MATIKPTYLPTRSIRLILTILRVLGQVNLEERQTSRFRTYRAYSIFMNVFLMGLFNLCQTLYLLLLTDAKTFPKLAYVVFSSLVATGKSCIFLTNNQLLRNLLSDLDLEIFRPDNWRQVRRFDRTMGFFRSVIVVLVALSNVLVISWIVSPMVKKDRTLQFLSWYPYNWECEEDPYYRYFLSYLHQTVSMVMTVGVNNFIDSSMLGFFTYIAAEFGLLCDKLRNLEEFRRSCGRESGSFNRALVECVRHYQQITRFVRDVGRCYCYISFIQFACSTISFCMTMFELSNMSPTTLEFFNVFLYQMVITVELFLICSFGNMVTISSQDVFRALYETIWYDRDESFRKDLLIFMLRTKKPMKMLAINFFPIELDSFIWIYKSAWSAFLVLRQVNQS